MSQDMAPPRYVLPSGEHIIIRVPTGTEVPAKLVGVEVYKSGYRFILEIPQEWIDATKAAMP